MKLLFENWRRYLDEVEALDTITTSQDEIEQILEYFYRKHAPKKGKRKELEEWKGHKMVSFELPGDEYFFFVVNNEDKAIAYVAVEPFRESYAVGNVRKAETDAFYTTELYEWLVERFGSLYSDKAQTEDGKAVWARLPNKEKVDTKEDGEGKWRWRLKKADKNRAQEAINMGRETWFHLTTSDRAELIEEEGLKVNQEACLTTKTGQWAHEYYETCPIYLSLEPYIKREELAGWNLEEAVVYEVDIADIPLVADLQSLVDKGANVDQDSKMLWWEESEEPEMLKDFLDDGAIEISRLLNDSDVIDAAIQTTKTAAIIEDILPEQIERSDY